eukprot:s1726_g8.t1
MRYLKKTLHYALSYGPAPNDYGVWNELQFKRDATLVEIFTDASFCPDESCKSFQSAMMFWGGCLVMWAGSRQSLIAASTAEAELISMVEGYSMGRSFLPTIDTLCRGYQEETDDFQTTGVNAEEAQRDEVTYQPTYEDLVAAYPQELRDYNQLHEQLNKSQRFGQEYVDRCAELRQVLHERCSEVERCEEELRQLRQQSLRLGDGRDPSAMSSEEALNEVRDRIGHREV